MSRPPSAATRTANAIPTRIVSHEGKAGNSGSVAVSECRSTVVVNMTDEYPPSAKKKACPKLISPVYPETTSQLMANIPKYSATVSRCTVSRLVRKGATASTATPAAPSRWRVESGRGSSNWRSDSSTLTRLFPVILFTCL